MQSSSVAPPLVELGRLVGWDPLPLSVRDARRRSAALRDRLASADTACPPGSAPCRRGRREGAASVRNLTVSYGPVVAVDGVDLDHHVRRGAGAHGEERFGEVHVAATHSPGRAGRPAATVTVDGGTPSRSAAQISSATSAWCRRTRGSFSTARACWPSAMAADKVSLARDRARPCRRCERVLPGMPRRPPSARPLRGPAPGPGPGHRGGPVAGAAPPRRADEGPGLPEQGSPHRRPARAGRRRSRHCAGHPRRRARGACGRPGRRAGGRAGHHRRPGPRGGLPLADLRPAGGQGPGARGMADGGRGPPTRSRKRCRHDRLGLDRPPAPPRRRAGPGDPVRHPLVLPALPHDALRRGRLRLAALDPPGHRPEHRPQRRCALDLRGAPPAAPGHRDGRALGRCHRRQGGGAARHSGGVLRRAARGESRHQRLRARVVPAHTGGARLRARVRFRPRRGGVLRVGADHGWRGPMAAVPDAGGGVGRLRRRLPARRCGGSRSDCCWLAYGVVSALALRAGHQFLVLALRRDRRRPTPSCPGSGPSPTCTGSSSSTSPRPWASISPAR